VSGSRTGGKRDRRSFLRACLRASAFAGAAGIAGILVARNRRCGAAGACERCAAAATCGYAAETLVWQLDPEKCGKCGKCATNCVLSPSAVKCFHSYSMCGYCNLCTGYFDPQPNDLNTGAENQLCPAGAIRRRFVEEPYYEYTIDQTLCIGCGKCVKGCQAFGNGSLFLQVRRDICINCNECAIARACPADAYVRIPASQGYILKGGDAGS